jgi:quercetin dioxygenase-like cupin family protein
MAQATKNFFYLAVLGVIATALGSPQSANTAATQDAAAQNAATKPSTSNAFPTVNPDPSGVMFFPNGQVSQSFAKGAVLYNGNPQRNYRVHIFHRDKPGEVEVHAKDTDIFYILDGSATLATGGSMLGGKETAPAELRGASIEGGVVRQVTKGDVIIVPANVPHWFREIQQPITYFGVKVR